jgi:hypothetical protein
MADNKYGRLFTIEDVEKIVAASGAEMTDVEGILAQEDAVGTQFKFPADEPLFLARAQDRYAEGAVRSYVHVINASPRVPDAHKDMAMKTARDFRDYRDNHEVKDPD